MKIAISFCTFVGTLKFLFKTFLLLMEYCKMCDIIC